MSVAEGHKPGVVGATMRVLGEAAWRPRIVTVVWGAIALMAAEDGRRVLEKGHEAEENFWLARG